MPALLQAFLFYKGSPLYLKLSYKYADFQSFTKSYGRVFNLTGFSLIPLSEIYLLSPGTITCLFFSFIGLLASRMNDFYF